MLQEGTNLIPPRAPGDARLEDVIHSQPCKAMARTLALIGNKWSTRDTSA